MDRIASGTVRAKEAKEGEVVEWEGKSLMPRRFQVLVLLERRYLETSRSIFLSIRCMFLESSNVRFLLVASRTSVSATSPLARLFSVRYTQSSL